MRRSWQRPLPLMGTARRRPRLPSQGHRLPGGSLRSDRFPRRGGCGNLGEVKAASSRLRLRPRPPGHRGIGSSSEKIELFAPRTRRENPRAHGGGRRGLQLGGRQWGFGVVAERPPRCADSARVPRGRGEPRLSPCSGAPDPLPRRHRAAAGGGEVISHSKSNSSPTRADFSLPLLIQSLKLTATLCTAAQLQDCSAIFPL